MDAQFTLSVVIPIYNTEQYLREAIDSIIEQSMGFENIQLILVNDGSTDSSGQICEEYANRYPKNVVFINKENGGVSSACNAGIAVAKGRYINLFGSDDRWESDALEKACVFLDEHYDEIDLVACRLRFFGAKEGFSHPLDYRFKSGKDRVVSLHKDYSHIQLMTGNCVIKAECLHNRRLAVDTAYGEDALLICDILLDRFSYGEVPSAVYHYRRRLDDSQLSTQATSLKGRYTIAPRQFLLRMLINAHKRCGYVPFFVQFTAMYETEWVFREPFPGNLSNEERTLYLGSLDELLRYVDPVVIFAQKHLNWPQKVELLKRKLGEDIFSSRLLFDDRFVWCGDYKLLDTTKAIDLISVKVLSIDGGILKLEGVFCGQVLTPDMQLFLQSSKGTVGEVTLTNASPYLSNMVTGPIEGSAKRFIATISLCGSEVLRFIMRHPQYGDIEVKPGFGIFAKLTPRLTNSYYVKEDFILSLEARRIRVFNNRVVSRAKRELRLEKEIARDSRYGKRYAALRCLVKLLQPFLRRPIWLLSDRFSKAGDNAENLFKYLCDTKEARRYNVFFLFEKEYADYRRLKNHGKVLDPHSKLYPLAFLLADKIISSHADATVINPFRSKGYCVCDLFDFDYVYIQHGVMPGNLSNWLNKLNKNAALITTSAIREREQLLLPEYCYSEENVALTGMPRHDALGHLTPAKKVVFLPTWRSKLAGEINWFERTREQVKGFSETEYCRFYNRLINDERLLSAMKKHGFVGEFYVHPSFEKQVGDFRGNETISVGSGLANYEGILNEAALMVTDYSSVAFDFGVQGKPVIYTQFDIDHIWDIHFYEQGYFHYPEDGFGPVYYEYDECVEGIIKMMEQNCIMPDKYRKRCDAFFAFRDHNNSKRVFEAIRELDERKAARI